MSQQNGDHQFFKQLDYLMDKALTSTSEQMRREKRYRYFNQSWRLQFSKATRQKFDLNILSDRVNMALLETYLTLKFLSSSKTYFLRILRIH